jgi:hypothetical protein
LEENDKRLPLDYQQYPGKMDHTTCICFCASNQNVPYWNVVSEVEKNSQSEEEIVKNCEQE